MDKRQKIKLFLVVALGVVGLKAQAGIQYSDSFDNDSIKKEKTQEPEINFNNMSEIEQVPEIFARYAELLNISNEGIFQDKISNDTLKTNKDVFKAWQEVCSENGTYTKPNEEEKIYLNKISVLDSTIVSYSSALKDYMLDAEDLILMRPDTLGRKMAEMSPQAFTGLNKPKNCYHAIKYLLMKLLPIAYMEGNSAWQAQSWLEDNPNFVPSKLNFSDLDKIVSSILVFDKTRKKIHGHISAGVRDDKGKELKYTNASGDVLQYNESRDHSDVARNAFVRAEDKYKDVKANFLAKTQLDIKTILKIGYQKVQKNTSHMYISPQDVYGALYDIMKASRELQAERILRAQHKHKSFLNEKDEFGYYKYAEQKIGKMPNTKRSSLRGKRLPSIKKGGNSRT